MDIPRPKKKKRAPLVLGLVGAVVLVAITVGLSRLKAAAPSVERDQVWLDSVKRGPMLRQVKGPGTLVPEYVRWLTADTAGRVERIHVRPGAAVEAGTLLLELANPDVQLQALEAERQLSSAEAQYVGLRMQLQTQGLAQEASLATLRADAADAARKATLNAGLKDQAFVADVELQASQERAQELERRVTLGQQQLAVVRDSTHQQLAAQKAQIEKLRAVAAFRNAQVESLQVRAGEKGQLTDLPLQLGQWVTPGTVLAKVVKPEQLKAELRIAETQARDVALGQRVEVDTRNGIVEGQVARVAPAASQGTVLVEVSLPGELPRGARPDLTVEGTIELERLSNVLFVGRPAGAQSHATLSLFRLVPGSSEAERVQVQLGRSSVNTIEVLQGLTEGDQVVLSDMTAWDAVERVKLQ
ncbi:MAG: HlyD family efflux transporter periplasmic adaptor subunit [Myxococcaceae bacterium]|nr:HlyD family efflux transporter periplasmic adaptor subunit [Myxococcaceae bacterium]MCI0671179.1 HlyD family efflux transporter periplasmic adaptor subunit [Myxococcaceae bacterium]